MRYYVDKNSKTPAYLQLYSQVREDIVKEVYKYGEKLPSKRLVADETGISTLTVEHAYMLLSDEGYIEAKQRSGYFVIFRKGEDFASYVTPSVSVQHPSSSAQGSFPFSVLSGAMRRVISDYGEMILEKSPNCGCIELRQALSAYLFRNRGISADPEQIIIGSGAEYLYSLIVGLLGIDKVFAIESPSYEKIEQVYISSGASIELLPLGSDGIESSALTATSADVLHVSPYRSFPTGITASASKKHEYVRWAERGERYLVEDDFESEFSVSKKMEETLFALSEKGNVIYLNTFTKTVSPSLRVGYMVIPSKLVPIFHKRLGFYSCTVPTFEQLLLSRLITNGDFERHINRVRRGLRKELQKNDR